MQFTGEISGMMQKALLCGCGGGTDADSDAPSTALDQFMDELAVVVNKRLQLRDERLKEASRRSVPPEQDTSPESVLPEQV